MDNQLPTTEETQINQTPITNIPPIPQPEEPALTESLPPQEEIPQPAVETPQFEEKITEPVQKIPEQIIKNPQPQLSDFGIAPKPPQSNFFKIIFIISLIVFLLVATAFAFVYFKSQNSSTTIKNNSSKISPKPTISSETCLLNDKQYSVGESFAAADSCNTCTCESQNVITCTNQACLTTPTATVTNSATKSATIKTSTSSSTVKK